MSAGLLARGRRKGRVDENPGSDAFREDLESIDLTFEECKEILKRGECARTSPQMTRLK